MAYPVNKDEVYEIDCLPAMVTVEMKGSIQSVMRALFRNKKNTVGCWLDANVEGQCVGITLPESLTCYGPGKYYLDVMDGCHICKTICLRLESSCFIEVKSVEPIEDELKEPYWKRKNVS